MSAPDDNATLHSILQTLAPFGSAFEGAPSETIRPEASSGSDADPELDALGRSDALDIEGTLGTGGMGVVYLATQRKLGRKVAVKTLKANARSPAARRQLLREASLAASLGHPSVVPVHDLRIDEDGTPRIVMRRIEGERWDVYMDDAALLLERFHAPDPLAWNLGVLVQVCHALQFAHSRGVLHRDIKPENVMIGAHGEVYLMDWGVAVRAGPGCRYVLPRRNGRPSLAGTPRYMAPEMVGAGDGVVDARTDVYLLGGVLYRVLATRAPHEGSTVAEIIDSILASTRPMPREVPPGLARLCRTAMATEPSSRPPTAAAFREQIEDYLHHRASTAIADAASDRARQLAAATAGGAPRREVYDLFAEVRFGLLHALASWPDNAEARAALTTAITSVTRYELAHGEPAAAAGVLAELDDPPVDLAHEVSAAVVDAERRMAKLTAIARDQDRRIGQRTRVLIAGIFTVLWTAIPIADQMFHLELPDVAGLSPLVFGYLLLAVGLGVWARESMLATALNRRVLATVVLVGLTHLVVDAGARLQGLPEIAGHVAMLFGGFCISAMAAITLDPRIAPSAIVYLIAYLLSAMYPGGFSATLGVANLVLLANMLWIWWPTRSKPPTPQA
jgi:hypothetical protein